jgi:hypothetical protein
MKEINQTFIFFQSVRDAYKLLEDLGAADRLIQHVQLLGEAADELIASGGDIRLDRSLV